MVETSRADFESFLALKERGQLPTLLEEAEASLGLPALPAMSELPSLLPLPGSGSSTAAPRGTLGALQSGDDQMAQRQRLKAAAEMEIAPQEFEDAMRVAAPAGAPA